MGAGLRKNESVQKVNVRRSQPGLKDAKPSNCEVLTVAVIEDVFGEITPNE